MLSLFAPSCHSKPFPHTFATCVPAATTPPQMSFLTFQTHFKEVKRLTEMMDVEVSCSFLLYSK